MPIKTVSVSASQIDGFKIESTSRQHKSIIDQPPAMGGTDAGPTPLEYLFISLAGCIVTIGHIVAKGQRDSSVGRAVVDGNAVAGIIAKNCAWEGDVRDKTRCFIVSLGPEDAPRSTVQDFPRFLKVEKRDAHAVHKAIAGVGNTMEEQ